METSALEDQHPVPVKARVRKTMDASPLKTTEYYWHDQGYCSESAQETTLAHKQAL